MESGRRAASPEKNYKLAPFVSPRFMAIALARVLEAPSTDVTATPLSWRAPSECPDAAEVSMRVARLMGRAPTAAELVVDADVTVVSGGYSLRLRATSGALVEERVLVAESCDVLADTAALVAAVIVDPIATAVTVEVPARAAAQANDDVLDDPTGTTATTRRAAIAPRPRSTPRPAASGPIELSIRARAGGQFGAVPGLTGGPDLALAIGGRRVRAEIVGSYWLPRRVDQAPPSLRVHLGTVSPRACGTLPQRRVDVAVCAGPEIGVMRGDVGGGGTRLPLWIAIAAEAGVRAPVSSRVAIWATVGAAAPLRFPRFRLVDETGLRSRQVYRPAVAAMRIHLGIEVRLASLGARRRRNPQ